MNLDQIKSQIGQPVLTMVRQLDKETQKPTEWLSHWDNEKRVRVTMHQEVFQKIMADKSFGGLAVKKEEVPASGERASYLRYVVITPKNIEATL